MGRYSRLSFALHAAALIATPLRRRGTRAGLATVVVGGLAGSTFAAAARRWGLPRALVAGFGIGAGTTVVEHVGTTHGVPFGRYSYTGVLRPTIRGVPAIVPLAWFAMALPARETAHAALGARSTRARRVVAGALCLTAWDLFLDPQMVGEGYWRWVRRGRYRDIPLSNFVGWFVTGLVVMAALDVLLPTGEPDPMLVGEYGWMAVMQTLGFAAFFGDPLVAAVGGAAMLPPAVVAATRLRLWSRFVRALAGSVSARG